MKSLPGIFIAIFLIAASPAWGSDETFDRYYDMLLAQQALTPERQELIWNHQVSPHQAALWLRMAGSFTRHSLSFVPLQHELYYRLGQLTHNRNARWTTETTGICNALMAALALFRSSAELPHSGTQAAVITALSKLPYNDLQSLDDLFIQPLWQVRSGTTVRLPIAVLPQQLLREKLYFTDSGLQNLNSGVSLESKLYAVRYQFDNGRWQAHFSTELPARFACRMYIMVIEVKLPADLPPGVYRGKVALLSGSRQISQLQYQLNIQDGGKK